MHAVDYSNILQKRKLDREKQVNDDQQEIATEINTEINDMASKYEYLVNFVEAHIIKMLSLLYNQIHEEEKSAAELPLSFKGVERHWFINLYRKTGEQPSKRFIVGPLGERPLHVCALSKYRFGAVDFEGQGNYFAEGVERGIKKYVTLLIEKGAWDEVTMPFGKDYCAAVGDFIKRENKEWKEFSKVESPAPPFWADLHKWYKSHLKPRAVFTISKQYSEMLVTRGLFEEETILFPFIAENDVHMVSWLLGKEDEPPFKELTEPPR